MNKKNIGYISLNFIEKDKIEVINWSKIINHKDLYSVVRDGQIEGGNVTDDLHVTLFYGFDEDKIDTVDIQQYINSIDIKDVEVGDIGTFPLPDYECKILYISVKDIDGNIKKYNEALKKFPHFAEYQRQPFVPHVTIAFIKKECDISGFIYTGPKNLHVEKVTHHIKETAK